MRYLPILFALFLCLNANGQNWRTVNSTDTNYFAGGRIHTGFMSDSATLKIIWVDSTQVSGADSIFYFAKHMREMPDLCFDTLSASWLGDRMIRKQDGIEYYFNHFGDTIIINTLAQSGDSWTIATDTAGLTYEASVTQTGQLIIGGVQDSFKTLSIQAFMNGSPVANHYNGKILEWTKENGWLKTLDVYFFPNIQYLLSLTAPIGICADTGQIALIHRSHFDVNPSDFQWRFAAGNEFILKTWSNYYLFQAWTESAKYDSIITSTFIHPDTLVVHILTKNLQRTFYYNPYPNIDDSGSYNITFHTDTIGRPIQSVVTNHLKPNINPGDVMSNPYFVSEKLFVDTICGRILMKTYHPMYGWLFMNTCLSYGGSLSGFSDNVSYGLYGFGGIYSHHESGQSYPFAESYDTQAYTYIKTADCTIGVKTNDTLPTPDTTTLAATGVKRESYYVTLYPNPAHNEVTLYSATPDAEATISITDVAGRQIFAQTGLQTSNLINTVDMQPGIYILTISGKAGIKTLKLVTY